MISEKMIEARAFEGREVTLVAIDTYDRDDYVDYRLDVTSNRFRYQVSGLNEADSRRLMKLLPPAEPSMHDARFSAYDLGDATSKATPGFYLFADQPDHPNYTENAVYKLENLSSGVAEGDLYRPRFRAVAISDPHWDDKLTAVLGKIQTVYAYDAASATRLAEITPSYELHFRKNVCEKPFRDAPEEADIEKVFNSVGFDYEIDFENEDGGENIIYMHCRDIDRKRNVAIPTDVELEFEYMFEEDENERQRIFEDLCSDLEGNGWFSDVAIFENRRTDEEILAAAQPQNQEPEEEPRVPGM
jgi:hypothetical protein